MRAYNIEKNAVHVQWRVWLAHAVYWWLDGVMLVSAVWAASVLALHILGTAAPVWVWLGLNGGVLLGGAALAWRRRPKRAQCIAAIERASNSGGIVLAYGEGAGGSGAWLERVQETRIPHLRWQRRQRLAGALAAVLCVVVAYVVPVPRGAVVPPSPMAVNELVASMEAEAALLEQARGSETGLAQMVRQQLAELAQTGAGEAQRHTWEALDHLRENMDAAAQARAQAALRAADEWHALDQAVQRMESAAGKGGAAERAALQQVREQVRMAAAQSMWSNQLAGAGSAHDGGAPATREELAALRGLLNTLSNQLMRQAGLLSTNMLMRGGLTNLAALAQQRCKGGSGSGSEAGGALERFLAQEPRGFERLCSNASGRACALAAWGNQGWGVSRGRGDAPLTFQEPSDEAGATRHLLALPEAPQRSPDDIVLLGESAHAPQETAADEPARGGALATAHAGAGQAQDEALLPRHRACVEEYFKD